MNIDNSFHYKDKEIILHFPISLNVVNDSVFLYCVDHKSRWRFKIKPDVNNLIQHALPIEYNILFGRIFLFVNGSYHIIKNPFLFPEEYCEDVNFIHKWLEKNRHAMQAAYVRKHIVKSLYNMALPSSPACTMLYKELIIEKIKILDKSNIIGNIIYNSFNK